MSKYIFREGQVPHNFTPAFERFLYNEERHRYSQSASDWITFSLSDENTEKILAQIHFQTTEGIASSPYKAPFGSLEFADTLSAETLLNFLTEAEGKLKEKDARKILIKDAPHIYRPQQAALLSVLLEGLNFTITSNEICSSIVVDRLPWESKISKDELYHLKRAQRDQLEFRQLDLSKLTEVYQFIEKCRHERGMLLSMTLENLKGTVQRCPDDFYLFGVFQNKEMIAASITIRVNERILYNFNYGNTKASNHLSPVVLLLNGQYAFCKQNGFQLLDLGTSMLDGRINFSLLNFKTQVGGIASMKLTFEKELI